MKTMLPAPLSFADWPEGDRLAWETGNRGDPLAPGGAGAGAAWRPINRRFVQLGYGRWLGWLKQGGGLDGAAPPAERATRVKVRAYLDALEAAGLADHTRAGRLQTLSDALRAMQPGADIGFIGRGAGRISSGAVRVRDPLAKMRPPSEIIAYGAELMAEAEASRCALAVDRALMYRDGLLLSLWILRALRIANLASIEIGRQLLSDGKGGHRLEFAGVEMKNGRPFGCAWPEPIEAQLQTYLERYRPTLLARNKHGTDDKGLWASQFGRRMKQASVGQAIMIRTEARFGVRMNPHLPRYILATTTAESHPERVSDVAAMLSHTTLETSQRHYIRAGSLAAAEKMQLTLLGGE